jgi:predicted DNA-binding protein
LSETVSTRLPLELIRLMERGAEAKGISLSMLLREIVEKHYGVKAWQAC